jgi:hypothetical protein
MTAPADCSNSSKFSRRCTSSTNHRVKGNVRRCEPILPVPVVNRSRQDADLEADYERLDEPIVSGAADVVLGNRATGAVSLSIVSKRVEDRLARRISGFLVHYPL